MVSIDKIKEDFIEVIKYSQEGIREPQVDALFDQWYNAKADYINRWKDYIYECGKVSFALDKESQRMNFNDFLYHLDRKYLGVNDLLDFLRNQGFESFYDNTLKTSCHLKNGVVIPAGSKIIRAFKYFIASDSLLRTLQDEASMVIQKNKLEGTLCFSVHPLDFLSSSENTYNWRSCHSLDGEYRAGNLSYMVDSSTVICYIKSDEDVKLPNFPEHVKWNNKKWRMLLFSNPTCTLLFAGRQYPFSSMEALEIVKEKYLTSLIYRGYNEEIAMRSVKAWSAWHNDFATPQISYANGEDCEDHYVTPYRYYFINNGIYDRRKIIKDVKGSLHFNDLLRSSVYEPYFCFLKTPYDEGMKIKIGGPVKCLCCGEENICTNDTMMCEECELKYGESEDDMFCYCELCGTRILSEDSLWCHDIGPVCQYCADEYCVTCAECGDRIHIESANTTPDADAYYCDYCIDDAIDEYNRRMEEE